MLRKTLILSLVGTAFLPACNPTTPQQGGTTSTGCTIPRNQARNGLNVDCDVTGGLPNRLIDPTNPANSGCGVASLRLSGQSINVPVRLIVGENGDENSGRIRVGAMIPKQTGDALATQSGTLRKAAVPDCAGDIGPAAPVATSFGGRHRAIVDKGQNPMCVFESRLDLNPYTQTIGPGFGPNVGAATRDIVRQELWARLDREIAVAINGLLNPNANLNGFSGRCADGWSEFSGP